MNPVRKRLRLIPSKLQNAACSIGTSQSTTPSKLISHNALSLPPQTQSPAFTNARTEENEEEEEGYLVVEEDTTDSSLVIITEENSLEVTDNKNKLTKRKRKKKTLNEGDVGVKGKASKSEEEQEIGGEVEIDRKLDQSLETKSKHHNLTSVNVKNIIHEVITNEHVVAMMKAAINQTEADHPFELKMTRSKLKEVVEKGVAIPPWNISPIKKISDNKAAQFVDIPLAEEDSSDEEYRPDEEEEDETAEDTFHESDMESNTSSPRGSRLNRIDEDSCSPWQRWRYKASTMGPPPPPKAPLSKLVTDSTFLEKLNAFEEELGDWTGPFQPLSESDDEAGLMACRTRSKRPLRNVPLDQLEAKLKAPDITPDMYDCAPEDSEWTDWLRGLMSSDVDNEEECDDDDDPEYNFLADNDEPDLEDYRDDKAVRITKREVNELMEELFETLKEDLTRTEADDEEEEPLEDSRHIQTPAPREQHIKQTDRKTHIGPTTVRQTVKNQLAAIRNKSQTQSNTHLHNPEPYTLKLMAQQKKRLEQQLQQHVQLLTQINMLTSPVAELQSEAETTRQFLFELDMLAQRGELAYPGFRSTFRVSNLQGAMELLEELRQTPINYQPKLHLPDSRGKIRSFPIMPAELAWIFATRPVFLYPELLPCASLDPAFYCPRRATLFTAAEDCLLVLGLRNMAGSWNPPKLVSQFLLRKTLVKVRRRILQCCRPGVPDNIVKTFRYHQVVGPMPMACCYVDPAEQRPPVDRENNVLPLWLARSRPVIHSIIKQLNNPSASDSELPPSVRRSKAGKSHLAFLRAASGSCSVLPGTKYPSRLPDNLDFRRIGFILQRQPPPPDSVHLSNEPIGTPSLPVNSLQSPCTPLIYLHCLPMTRPDINANINAPCSLPTETTLAGLRVPGLEFQNMSDELTVPAPKQPAFSQKMEEDVMRRSDKEEEEDGSEEGSHFLLALSDSSVSPQGSVAHDDQKKDESENDLDVTVIPSKLDDNFEGTSSEESSGSFTHWQLLEQQLFEKSEMFLQQLRQSLGEGSPLYHQVVSLLQTSSSISSEDVEKVVFLLRHNPDVQLVVQDFFKQFQSCSLPVATSSTHISFNGNKHSVCTRTENDQQKDEKHQAVCAKNITMTSTGEKVVVWTREVDRTILMACQQQGANRKTFRQVSAQLGNKTARQVQLRFHDLRKLFDLVPKNHQTAAQSADRPQLETET